MIMSVFRPSRRKNGKRVRSRFYYGQYRLSPDAKIVRMPLHTPDRRIAEERLRKVVLEEQRAAEGLIPPQAIRDAAQRELVDHLDNYSSDLRKRGTAEMYVYNVEHRVARLAKECGWVYPRDVTADTFVAWRTHQTKAPRTLNQYLEAIAGLLKWMQRQGRLAANPLVGVTKVETRGREVRKRRALSDDQLKNLIEAVSLERRAVYLVAAFTGLRRSELAQLTWSDVHLNGKKSFVRARASTTKNRLDAVLPLHGDVVDALRTIRPTGVDGDGRVFNSIPSVRQLRKDLAKAGIVYKDGQGRQADFHSLRHTFGTNLGRAGIQPRVAMELMRHTDIRLTTSIYTDASKLPTSAAIASLPGVTAPCAQGNAQNDAQNPVSAGPGESQGVIDADADETEYAADHGEEKDAQSADDQGDSPAGARRVARSRDGRIGARGGI
ncbi:tyrosine-type recombinase/integrase [Verrucomicrobiota bacterium]